MLRGRPLAPDVLLAGGEGEHVAAAALRSSTVSPTQAARHLAHVLAARGEEAQVRAAEAHGHAEALRLAADDVRAARRPGGRKSASERASLDR